MSAHSENETTEPKLRLILAGLGLLQGIGMFLLIEVVEDLVDIDLLLALGVFLVIAPVWLALSYGLGRRRFTIAIPVAYGIVLAVLWLWFDARVDWFEGKDDPGVAFGYFIAGALLASYILLAFLQAGLREGRLHFPYAQLFVHSWSNVIILVVAGISVGLAWLVLWLWWALFGLIDIDLFEDVFTDAAFAWPFTGVVAGLGIAIARENPKIVPALRRIVLLICQFLAPVLAAASILFLLALPFAGLSTLWKTGSATAILTVVLFGLVLLSNAVIQDGEQNERSPRWLNSLIAASLLLSPVIGGLAMYAMSLRIAQYGFTPDRFIGLLIVIVAALHAAVYAIGVLLRRRQWDQFVFQANRGLALVVAAAALLISTPVLDPFAWSARNQLNRLADGQAEAANFDYAYLKFRLGAPGREALEEIVAWSDHPEQALVDERMAQLADAKNYYEWRQKVPVPLSPRLEATHFELIPEPFDIPEGLIAAMQRTALTEGARACEQRPCLLLPLDLNRDGEMEYAVVTAPPRPRIVVMLRKEEDWKPLYTMDPGSGHVFDSAYEALRKGDYELVDPAYSDIRIGERVIRF